MPCTFCSSGMVRQNARRVLVILMLTGASCTGEGNAKRAQERSRAAADTVLVFAAASMVGSISDVVQAHSERTGAVVLVESGGSLEHARKLTELGRVPDVLLLADEEVFSQRLLPRHATWYLRFARDRMVIAYTTRSRHARDIREDNWPSILRRSDVEVGRPDPARAPAGYRALLALDLAARHLNDPSLAAAVLARAPARNTRPDAASLAALLATGEVDYIFEYESLARARGFGFVRLPPEADLGDLARADAYAVARVRVPGDTRAESVTVAGAPIVHALAVPRDAPHPAAGQRFVEWLLSDVGRVALRAAHVDLIEPPQPVGDAPAWVRALAAAP